MPDQVPVQIRPARKDEIGWVISSWYRSQPPPSRQRQRSRDSIAHLLERCEILVAVSDIDPDAVPFGWIVLERWRDGSVTVHFVYVRGRVPARQDAPASPDLRGFGVGSRLIEGLGPGTWYTTACRASLVPKGWRFDPWR